MPQLTQLSEVALSQFLWIALALALIYFGVGRAMLPKIQSTVDARDAQIAGDLKAAEEAKLAAEATEEAYRAAMDKSRAEAMKLTAEAKQKGTKATEERVAKADEAIHARIGEAEARIRQASVEAKAEIDAVAAEIAQQIAGKVAGIKVSRDEAAQALKAATS